MRGPIPKQDSRIATHTLSPGWSTALTIREAKEEDFFEVPGFRLALSV
jgi:hypothetical protein